VKYVLLYESADNMAEKAQPLVGAHRERWQSYLDRGELLMIGPFSDPQNDGSMAVFRTREAAEEFAAGDPFVLNGVVKGWRVLGWNEVLAP
jgi:uncharacterized protein YciI